MDVYLENSHDFSHVCLCESFTASFHMHRVFPSYIPVQVGIVLFHTWSIPNRSRYAMNKSDIRTSDKGLWLSVVKHGKDG